ncbi:ABC transporter permease [Microbacterium thalli]|uniref:ABC transporter permease n=1 Tax=Microbacterium thalli TaxID=3027921 RepID=A0ABT5SDM3_9MICO|nr:ABC transporter permease [Microbacterium thalli]MDD7960831.1 ABC transporter permease [Microbacterium thalli]
MTVPSSSRSRLRAADLVRLGSEGIRSKPLRAVLSALGIAIGVAAMVAVLGISASSQARLNASLAELGTNLLTTTSEPPAVGDPVPLPVNADARLARLPGIETVSSLATLADVHVYRSSLIDPARTGGLLVAAAGPELPGVVAADLASGRWFDPVTAAFPTTVLGATAAERLGITEPGGLVWLGGVNTTVIGILDPVALAPEIDITALVGMPLAYRSLDFSGEPTTLYQRVDDEAIASIRPRIARVIHPDAPSTVAVSRPSDALAAVNAVDDAFTGMLLGLGGIALLVGAIGVANTMVISVIERRREIGLRRALGATRRHIRLQFLTEALVLSALGGGAGAVIGFAVTTLVATINGWPTVLPVAVPIVGVASTLVVGAVAGLYPAVRAARTPPHAALSS